MLSSTEQQTEQSKRTLLVIGDNEAIRKLLALLNVPLSQRDVSCVEVAFEDWLCFLSPVDAQRVLYNNPEVLYNLSPYKWLWWSLDRVLPSSVAQWLREEYSRRNVKKVMEHRKSVRGFAVEQEVLDL